MNRYLRISERRPEVSAKDIATAKNVDDFNEIFNASKAIDKYVFVEDETATKRFRTADALALTIEVLANGTSVNRAVATINRANYPLRVWNGKGRDDIQPAKVFTKDEIAKLTFGFCKSGDDFVREVKVNPSTGELGKYKILYVSLA